MYSFLICLCALILGYIFYGRFVDRVFGPDPNHLTPALKHPDGVDNVPLPTWKVFMIQFLNIAGTGPIFGAIMGAKFGPASFLWIVLGSILAGGVHDYFSGMLSVRHNGFSLPRIVGHYLGKRTKKFMRLFSLLLLLLVGAVFVFSPALILGDMVGGGSDLAVMLWVVVIFLYYLFATILPIDKLIGRIYPLFAMALLFMAFGLMVCLIVKWPSIPEIWQGLGNLGEARDIPGMASQDIFPCMLITIACGAISGFHSTQCPIMARCIKSEKLGRPVFYGSMIMEGIVALVWAAISSYFFFSGGAAEMGSDLTADAPVVVTKVSSAWLGAIGGILAIIGVVVAPITSGDTAFRSARLILAEYINVDQKPKKNRIYLALPLFAFTAVLLWFNITDEDGFNIIWRYFGWANQSLACFTLWTATVYLVLRKKGNYYLISMIPAAVMNSVCVAFICTAKIGFNMPSQYTYFIAPITFIVSVTMFYAWKYNIEKKNAGVRIMRHQNR